MLNLDHAATSHPKPAAVWAAMQHWFGALGVSADRGASSRCREVAHEVHAVRSLIGRLVGMAAERVAFVSGATEGLNLLLRALLRPGDHVLTTAFEHSSVARPLRALGDERNLTIDVLAPDGDGGLDPVRVREALAAVPTRLLVFTHASNVTGACFDAAAFCSLARAAGAVSVLDACQTAGLIPLAVGADAVVASGHKALAGPPGIGFVAVRDGLDPKPQKQGGTGGSVALEVHPDSWPQAFEAGTPNTPAIVGLGAALRTLPDPQQLLADGLSAVDRLLAGFRGVTGLRILHPANGPRVPIVSCVHADYDPMELGALFDDAGIQVRAGFHCAPWLHRHLGTESAGTLRLSPGPGIGPAEIDRVLAVFQRL